MIRTLICFLAVTTMLWSEFDYEYRKGESPEKMGEAKQTLLTLNTCMLDGDFPVKYGGVLPAALRIDKMSNFITKHDADVFLGQEVSLTSGSLLYDKLKEKYSHFWIGIGVIPGEIESGLFVASKYPIVSKPLFFPFSLKKNGAVIRGFFCLETHKCWIITTHMEAGSPEKSGTIRRDQLSAITMIMDIIAKRTGKPYIVAGDLNIERTNKPNDEYSASGIPEDYYDFYSEHHPEFDDETYTCTNLLTARMLKQPEPLEDEERNEIDDYVLIRNQFKDLFPLLQVELIRDTYNLSQPPSKALTDHRAYKATFIVK